MVREQFLKAYSNVPADERNQILIIIENKPYTWLIHGILHMMK